MHCSGWDSGGDRMMDRMRLDVCGRMEDHGGGRQGIGGSLRRIDGCNLSSGGFIESWKGRRSVLGVSN